MVQNWLGTNIVINGGDSAYGIGPAYWSRTNGELYFTSAEIPNFVPLAQNPYDIFQINVEFDGTVTETRPIVSGLITDGNSGFAGGYRFGESTYKVLSSTETANGYEIRATNAFDWTAPFQAPVTVLDDTVLTTDVVGFGFANSYDNFYSLAWGVPSGANAELFFQAFDPATDLSLSANPVSLGSFSLDNALEFARWNGNSVVGFVEFDDAVEGNKDVRLITARVDGTVSGFERDFVIDLDRVDIDKIFYTFAGGQISTANMLIITLENDIAAPTPTSHIKLSFVEDTGTAGNVISEFGFDLAGSESDFYHKATFNPLTQNAVHLITFIDGGNLTGILFDSAAQQFSAKFNIQNNVSLDEFAGTGDFGDGRFLVNWYQDNNQGGRELVGQIIDIRDGAQNFGGGTQDDVFAGSVFNDDLQGNDGDDRLAGGLGEDTIGGGAGNDRLSGGGGNDIISGGNDDDILSGGLGDDAFDGGAGVDTVDYSTSLTAIIARLDLGTVTGEGSDTIVDVENLIGSQFADIIYGTDDRTEANIIKAGDGADRVYGGRGTDEIHGEGGADLLIGDGEADVIYGGADNDRIYGKFGNDIVYGGDGADLVVGDAANDTLYGDDGNDRLYGGTGNDIMYGGAGADLYDGSSGDDIFKSSAGADRLNGRAGIDTFEFEQGNDNDRIFLFEDDIDKIEISTAFGFTDANDLITNHSRAVGNTLYIDLDPAGGDYVQIVNWLATHTAADLVDDISIVAL